MQNIQTTQNSTLTAPPAPTPPELIAALSVGLQALDSGLLCEETLPAKHVQALRARRAELVQALAPAPRAKIVTVLASLSRMPAQGVGNEAEAEAGMRQDVEDLSDVALWSLTAAARAFRRMEITEEKWRPSAGQLRKEARRREIDVRAEIYGLNRLLEAPMLCRPRPEYLPRHEVDELHKRITDLAGKKSS